MLKELKFVQGAVAKKDFVPEMTHFRIEGGRVRSFNGQMAICSPIDLDLDCIPKADAMIRAISNCNGENITLSLLSNKKLLISSGRFRAHVETVAGETPHVEPSGDTVELDGEVLLTAFKTLERFMGNDASRPWSGGILLKGSSAYATNNVCVAEYWTGVESPIIVNVPRMAIREMLRIDEPPTGAQYDENSITFHYSDGRWIRTQLLLTEWPPLERILERENNPVPIDPEMFEGLDVFMGLGDNIDRVYFNGDVMRTHKEDDIGATYEVPGMAITGIYQRHMLGLLRDVATSADFSLYPKPALFYGNRLRGAIAGLVA